MPRPSRPPASPHASKPARQRRASTLGSQTRRVRDRYELHEVAGRGGMAVVWRATQHGDAGFARTVAVKQMHEHLADSRLYVDMFAEEARVLSSIGSPNVATIYDFVEEKGQYYLVMEWIEGIDLGTYIHHYTATDRRTRWDLVTAVGIGVMRALAAAHERRAPDGQPAPIVHRDVSPHNILITSEGMVKLIDFGLSLARDREKELTEPGIVKGKMSYLSPEIVAGQRPSPLSDQFAAGSVLWEALVGRKLFEGQTDYEVYKKLRDGQIQPLRPLRRDAPRELTAVIHRALSPDAGQRFGSAREMAGHLSQVLRSHRAPKDLHELLGQSAAEAREALGHLPRDGEVSTTTPVADIELQTVDRPATEAVRAASAASAARAARDRRRAADVTPPPVEPRRRPTRDTAMASKPEDSGEEEAPKRGLLHKIPFFWKR